MLVFYYYKSMLAAEKHRTAENLPPLFQHLSPILYNNKIRNTRTNSLKKSYQQGKMFISCGLLINNLLVTLPVYSLIS